VPLHLACRSQTQGLVLLLACFAADPSCCLRVLLLLICVHRVYVEPEDEFDMNPRPAESAGLKGQQAGKRCFQPTMLPAGLHGAVHAEYVRSRLPAELS
jgi:hypothetical protein